MRLDVSCWNHQVGAPPLAGAVAVTCDVGDRPVVSAVSARAGQDAAARTAPKPSNAPASRRRGLRARFCRSASTRPKAAAAVAPATCRDEIPEWARRYGVAVVSVVGSVLLTLLLYSAVFARNPFALFYAAVMISAWYGGLGPGLLATALAAWAIDHFFVPSFLSPSAKLTELFQVGVFGSVALLIAWLNGNRKGALAERDDMVARAEAAKAESDAARTAAEDAGRRSAFLAAASKVLAASFDYEQTLAAVAKLAVPAFADACTIDLLEESPAGTDGGAPGQNAPTLRRVAAHANPAMPALSALIRTPADMALRGSVFGLWRGAESGDGQVLGAAPPAAGPAGSDEDPHVAALRAGGVRSSLSVPLPAGGREGTGALGVITFLSGHPTRKYGGEDLLLADDLARRAALSVDHARLYREAQDANRMKDEFLAVVSHELRTPLNAILGWSYLLSDGLLDGEGTGQAVSAIDRNARAQARIIDDVLDVSRIIRGRLSLSLKDADLPALVDAALDAVRLAAEDKGVDITCEMDAGPAGAAAPLRITGDPDRLQQVVWNLLSNAVKFTPEGGRVRVRCGREGEQVVIAVRDSGEGIAPEFLPHVFERFRQADASSTRRHGGLGLGLAIVKHLVELHAGTIEVHSDGLGRGATFTVRLPAGTAAAPTVGTNDTADGAGTGAASAADSQDAQDAQDASDSLRGVQVLVVDDEPDARDLFSNLLRRCGAAVTAVATADEALRSIEAAWPDVLLSDIGMPGEDGYSLIRRVRAIEAKRDKEGSWAGGPPEAAFRPLPAVALTAFAGAEDRRRALREGFQMHVPKPVQPEDLAAAVACLAGRG